MTPSIESHSHTSKKDMSHARPFNPFKLNGISQLDQSFSVLRVLGGILHFYSVNNRTFCKQTVENLIRCRVLQRLIWVCAACLRLSHQKDGLMVKFSTLLKLDQINM